MRFTDEELKHQELFRRIEAMIGRGHARRATASCRSRTTSPARCSASRTWAVLALTCHIELFTQAHYRQSIEPDAELSELWKDVFLFHWKEESQHAILDELEWRREDAKLTPAQRDQAVTDLIELVAAVDGILQVQAAADADYFLRVVRARRFDRARGGPRSARRCSRPTAGSTSSRACRTSASARSSAAWSPRRRCSASARRSRRS